MTTTDPMTTGLLGVCRAGAMPAPPLGVPEVDPEEIAAVIAFTVLDALGVFLDFTYLPEHDVIVAVPPALRIHAGNETMH